MAETSTPTVPPRIWYGLKPYPPLVSQVDAMSCWAAGIASFQIATGINPSATRNLMVTRYTDCILLNASNGAVDGSISNSCRNGIFSSEGVERLTIAPADFTYDRAIRDLRQWGYLILIQAAGVDDQTHEPIDHTLVLYGVGIADNGAPDRGYFNVMDPSAHIHQNQHTAGYVNLRFDQTQIKMIGHRRVPAAVRHHH